MTREPFDDAPFPPSTLSGWLPTAPDDAGAGARLAAGPLPGRAGRPARAPQPQSRADAAHGWLARIPPRFQPLATARAHPHIVNRMAELWGTPTALTGYFAELLLSRREGRQGFSFDVLTELFDLQALTERPVRH